MNTRTLAAEAESFCSATPKAAEFVLSNANTYDGALRVSKGTTASCPASLYLKMAKPLTLSVDNNCAEPTCTACESGPVLSRISEAFGARVRSNEAATADAAGVWGKVSGRLSGLPSSAKKL